MALQDLIGRVGQAAADYAKFVADNLGKLGNWVASGFTSGLDNGNNAAYVPPFFGGQCPKLYSISFVQTYADGSKRYYAGNGSNGLGSPPSLSQELNSILVNGAISSINWSGAGLTFFGSVSIEINGAAYYVNNIINDQPATGFAVYKIVPNDGSADNCGNLPPPSGGGTPQDNPYPSGGAPADTSGDLINGTPSGTGSPPPFTPAPVPPASPPPTDPSLAGIGASLDSLFDFLRGLIQLINSLLELMDKLNKLFSKKEQRVFGLGSVKGDGYLSFSPMVDSGWNPLSLEVFVYKKPVYLSKWFGYKSPNYFNSGLGSIAFVDGSFSIRNGRKEVNYVRSSFDCPQSIGVYYHFGLDEQIEAQITLIMEKS